MCETEGVKLCVRVRGLTITVTMDTRLLLSPWIPHYYCHHGHQTITVTMDPRLLLSLDRNPGTTGNRTVVTKVTN